MKSCSVLILFLTLNWVIGSPVIKIGPTLLPPSFPSYSFTPFSLPPNNKVVGTEYSEFYPVAARDYKGNLYVAYQYERVPGEWDVGIVMSEDGGKTWKAPWMNWPLIDERRSNLHPSIAIGPRNEVFVVVEGTSPVTNWPNALYFLRNKEEKRNTWEVYYLEDERARDWYRNCSYPDIAIWGTKDTLYLWIVFQYNKPDGDADIRSFYGYIPYTGKGRDSLCLSNFKVLYGVPVVQDSGIKEGKPSIALYIQKHLLELTHPLIAYEYGNESKDIKIVEGDTLDYGPPEYDAPLTIAGDSEIDEHDPYLVSSGDYFYCAYTSGDDAYVAYSTDKGKTFTSVNIDTTPGVKHRPVVVCNQEKVGVAYYYGESHDAPSGNVLYKYSPDNGQTWSEPETVSTKSEVVDTPRIAIAACSHIFWVDRRNWETKKWDIYHGSPKDTVPAPRPPGIRSPSVSESPQGFLAIKPSILKERGVIEYQVSTPGPVSLDIYDPTGRLVKSLLNTCVEPGIYKIEWDSNLPSGVYFVSLRIQGERYVKRVVFLR